MTDTFVLSFHFDSYVPSKFLAKCGLYLSMIFFFRRRFARPLLEHNLCESLFQFDNVVFPEVTVFIVLSTSKSRKIKRESYLLA